MGMRQMRIPAFFEHAGLMLSARWMWPAIALCAAMAIAPILLSSVPPLLDYPSHIARIFIIHDLLSGGRFAEMYALQPAVIPNLGMDIVLLGAIGMGIDIETAGRLLLVMLVLGLGWSVLAVHRRLFGRWSVFPLLSFAFVYNKIMMLGFINYLLGICLALLGFACWLSMRDRGAPARTALMLIGWSIAAFLCHLMAVMLLLGLVGAHAGSRCLADLAMRKALTAARDGARAVAMLLPPVLVTAGLYLVSPFAGNARPAGLNWGMSDIILVFRDRLNALVHAADGYDPVLDHVVLAVVALLLVGGVLAGRLRVAWSMLPALAAILVAGFVVPYHWAGTSFIADRIPILLVLLGIASLDIEQPPRRYAFAYLALPVLLLVGARSVSAGMVWRAADRAYASMRAALDELPEGTSIYGATIYAVSFQTTLQQPWTHFPSMAVLRKPVRAVGVFAEPSQNILVRRPALETLAALRPSALRVGTPGKPSFENDVFAPERLAKLDYVLVANPGLYPGGIPANLVQRHTAGEATLFEISHAPR